MSNNETSYKDLIAFHPGSYIEEIIEDLNITQKEFAERLGVSPKMISKLVNAEESISKETANKLAKVTGISISTWLKLQNTYDIKVIEIEEQQKQDEVSICEMIDFKYFKQNGFVENKTYSVKEKIVELRKLLRIASLSYLNEFNNAVSYRNTKGFSEEKNIVNSNVVLELATNNSRNITDNKLNKARLEKKLPEIRKMTLQDPGKFYPELKEMLLECGIILYGMPKLTNAYLNGATKKFQNGSVLLLITDRNKSSDIFWFSLFHELGHILNNDFYSNHEDKEAYKAKEENADLFARNILLPQDKYLEFIDMGRYTEETIKSFAIEMKIHPSIIVGRLQNDKKIERNMYNYFKINYNICLK
ncbi:HigA family addiction module antitoxin [Lactococcus lactis]|jgi:addiction module HigA family antidote|uniref:HigA family addiction module antitoxin n=1 Tax=Lactococcus lactis TaxID=1358 RepID=UPI0021A90BB6|nr:HigA family addiction module antitoxin [Lactococcus lactis]MCT0051813.1 addiction module antidote protein, HigA family [Lactococcus lactis subsp. lactis]